jgi:hypothetical protein
LFPFEGVVIALTALLCLYFQLRLPARLPDESEYQAVQKILDLEAQDGDVLLLHPWWTERARLFAPDRLPVVGYQGSDGDDLERYRRIWVLSQPELPRADVSSFTFAFAPRRTAIGSERTFGHLHLSLYENGRHKPVTFSAIDAIAGAQTYVENADGSRRPLQVPVEWHEIHFQPRHCLRLFPPGGSARAVAEFSNMPASVELQLTAGMIWDRGFAHDPRFTTTEVVAEVNGQPAASLTIPVGLEGVQRASGPPIPQGSTLRIWSRSQNPELREVCVEAYGFGG